MQCQQKNQIAVSTSTVWRRKQSKTQKFLNIYCIRTDADQFAKDSDAPVNVQPLLLFRFCMQALHSQVLSPSKHTEMAHCGEPPLGPRTISPLMELLFGSDGISKPKNVKTTVSNS